MTRARSLSRLANSNVFTVSDTNRVGIGSTIPDVKLDVGGDLYADNLTINNLIGVAATFSGVVSYEDVTNVDSVGIITAQSYVSIADSIVHTGDTDTSIRFPEADTFTVETAGSERVRVNSSGDVRIGSSAISSLQGATLLALESTGSANWIEFCNSGTNNNAGLLWTDEGAAENANLYYDNNVQAFTYTSEGTHRFRTGGSERVRIDSSGNVGINSTGQIRQLEIYHGTHATASLNSETQSSLFFSKPTDTNIGQISYNHGSDYMYFRVNDAERVRIDSSGNIGIGTDDPRQFVHILDPGASGIVTTRIQHESSNTPTDGGAFLQLGGTRSTGGFGHYGGIFGGRRNNAADNSGYLAFYVDNNDGASMSERVRITHLGHVGINTQSPNARLDINNPADGGGDAEIYFQRNGTPSNDSVIGQLGFFTRGDSVAFISAKRESALDDAYLQFSTQQTGGGVTERLRIGSSGKTVITGGGSEQLRVKGTEADLWLESTGPGNTVWRILGSTGTNTHKFRIYDHTNSADRLGITTAGHVKIEEHLGIGVDPSSTYPLMVAENTRYQFAINNTGADQNYPWFVHDTVSSASALVIHFNGVSDRFTFKENGDFIAVGNVTAYSDVSLKENIETIPNALDKVLNLRGVYFDKKDQPDVPRQMGVIAQEVEEVVPEVVSTGDDEMKTVAYGNLVGLLIESIKELKAEVNDLKAQLEG